MSDSNHKILFIDDDNFLLDMYSLKLKESGFEVHALIDAKGDFVEKVVKIQPELIYLDIIMPDVLGFEAIELLKADPRTKDIPVIFESNMGEKEDINKGVKLGAFDYLVIAYITPKMLVQTAIDFFNGSKDYIKRYPIFLEMSEMEFVGKDRHERAKNWQKFIEDRMLASGINLKE